MFNTIDGGLTLYHMIQYAERKGHSKDDGARLFWLLVSACKLGLVDVV